MDKEQALEKHTMNFESGSVLFYEGDPGSKIWVISEGHIQLTKRVCSEEILIEILGPGEFCGELALVTGEVQPTTATVLDNARLIAIEPQQFETMLRYNGELSIRMLKKLAGRLNEAHFKIATFQLKNTLGRVMMQLRNEIEHSDTANKTIVPAELAQMLGIDNVELQCCLQKLVDKNLITLSKENVYSIVSNEEYSRYLNYLELKDRYDFSEKN